MSFNLIRDAWDVKGLDAQSRLVLLLLADVADEAGVCWPSVAFISERTGLGDRAIRYRLTELDDLGLLSRTRRHRRDGSLSTYTFRLHLPACGAGSPPACGAAHEPTMSEPTISSSLRSEEELNSQVATVASTPRAVVGAFWEWHKSDRGAEPSTDYLGLVSIARNMLKRGYTSDEIVDAMKTTKVMTAKAVSDEAAKQKHAREATTTTQSIPASIVRAFAKCEPWFERHGLMQTSSEKADWMLLCATQIRLGYGHGETMMRLAVALRSGNNSPFALTDANVDRFNGEPADYPDAMERAYTNRAWRAS